MSGTDMLPLEAMEELAELGEGSVALGPLSDVAPLEEEELARPPLQPHHSHTRSNHEMPVASASEQARSPPRFNDQLPRRASQPGVPTHRLQTPWVKKTSSDGAVPATLTPSSNRLPNRAPVTKTNGVARDPTREAIAASTVPGKPAAQLAAPTTSIPKAAPSNPAPNTAFALPARAPPAQRRSPISPKAPARRPSAATGPTAAEKAEQMRKLSTSAISCAYCTATGVNSAWRRDRAGKPLCGRCCDQLRRRMNPRYAGAAPPPSARAAARPAPYPARRSASPPKREQDYAYPRPGPDVRYPSRPIEHTHTMTNSHRAPPPPPDNHGPAPSTARYPAEPPVALPPMSSLERAADGYRYGLPAAKEDHPTYTGGEHFAGLAEESLMRKRATLMEGRRWILDMLDDTSSLLRMLHDAAARYNGPRAYPAGAR